MYSWVLPARAARQSRAAARAELFWGVMKRPAQPRRSGRLCCEATRDARRGATRTRLRLRGRRRRRGNGRPVPLRKSFRPLLFGARKNRGPALVDQGLRRGLVELREVAGDNGTAIVPVAGMNGARPALEAAQFVVTEFEWRGVFHGWTGWRPQMTVSVGRTTRPVFAALSAAGGRRSPASVARLGGRRPQPWKTRCIRPTSAVRARCSRAASAQEARGAAIERKKRKREMRMTKTRTSESRRVRTRRRATARAG